MGLSAALSQRWVFKMDTLSSDKHVMPKGVGKGRDDAYLTVPEGKITAVLDTLFAGGFELVDLFCVEDFDKRGFSILYALEKKGENKLTFLVVPLTDSKAESVAYIFPSALWYEREVSDGFGVSFNNAFDTRRLFLHEAYPEGFHPLSKAFKNGVVATAHAGRMKNKLGISGAELRSPSVEYKFKEIGGEGVFEIPVGPVHAGIIEPGHFRFSVIGETIYALELRMFYKHRGVEKLAEGKTPFECVKIAEAISGDETVANSVAFCSAVEKISDIKIPPRASYLRTMFLELERIYSHLGDLAGMNVDVAFMMGASPFFALREEVFRQNALLTGSRFMKGAIDVGGLTKDVSENALTGLGVFLTEFPGRFSKAVDFIRTSTSVIDRFDTTGVIKKELVPPLHITGPAARASGIVTDTRVDHPYGIYAELMACGVATLQTGQNGDVLSRFMVKAAEIEDSVRLIKKILAEMPKGSVTTFADNKKAVIKDGYASSLVESARGQSFHWVCIRKGMVYRYKVRTASFCNWQAIEHAVIGNIVPDFPLINKSLNLSYAGTDL